jgi:hypothetical protein
VIQWADLFIRELKILKVVLFCPCQVALHQVLVHQGQSNIPAVCTKKKYGTFEMFKIMKKKK